MVNKPSFTESYNPGKIRKETTWRIIRLGIISVCVVIFTLWLGFKLFPLTTQLPETIGSGEKAKHINWGILDGIASLITMSLVVGGVVFAFLENVQNAVQRSRENAVTSFSIYKGKHSVTHLIAITLAGMVDPLSPPGRERPG